MGTTIKIKSTEMGEECLHRKKNDEPFLVVLELGNAARELLIVCF